MDANSKILDLNARSNKKLMLKKKKMFKSIKVESYSFFAQKNSAKRTPSVRKGYLSGVESLPFACAVATWIRVSLLTRADFPQLCMSIMSCVWGTHLWVTASDLPRFPIDSTHSESLT